MTETFYRFHWAECPDFSAANAYSVPWGTERNADGSQTRCLSCDGSGTLLGETCADCDGEGWQDATEGYSCCRTAEDLIAYFATRSEPADNDGEVVIFDGRLSGNGFDGEPLAVPTSIVKRMTWTEFVAR